MEPSVLPPSQGLTLGELGRALLRFWWLAALVALATVGGVMAVTLLLLTPSWESEASLRVQQDRGGGGGLGAALGGGLSGMEDALPLGGLSLPGMTGGDVTTEMGVLASRRIQEGVALDLALHVHLERPRGLPRSLVLQVLEAGEDDPRGTFTLRRGADGRYAVSARGTRVPVALPEAPVQVGEPFRVGPMVFRIVPPDEIPPLPLTLAEKRAGVELPSTIRFTVRPFRREMRDLRRRLRVHRTDTGSRIIALRYRNADPFLARDFVNGVVDAFLDYALDREQAETQREVEVLTARVLEHDETLAEAEARLQRYQERERIVAPEEQAIQQIRRIAELQVGYDGLRVEQAALSAFVQGLKAREPRAWELTSNRSLSSFPTFLANGAVQELLVVLADLETERSELRVLRTDENRDLMALQGRIREMEEQLGALALDYLGGLEVQIRSAREALDTFQEELESIPAVELEYARLQRERRLLAEVSVLLRARLMEARLQEALDEARVRVLDRGVMEDRPISPRPPIALALSLVLGALLGLFAVVVVALARREDPATLTPGAARR